MSVPAASCHYGRRLGAAMFYRGLRVLGVTAINRRFRDAGVILCYHNVVDRAAADFGDPGVHLFRARFQGQMEWLARRYNVVPLAEFVDRLQHGASLRSVAAVTFDDGYAGVFEHAVPILRRLSLPATIFLVADASDRRPEFWWDRPEIVRAATPVARHRWLRDLRGDGPTILAAYPGAPTVVAPPSHRAADWETVRGGIGHGIEIGVHSASHRSLPTLSDAELDREIVGSRAIIHEATGIRPEFFAYPYGSWDTRVRARIRTAGYRGSFTLDSGLNRPLSDPWSLRRVNVPATISNAAFEAWTAGLH